MKTLVVFLYLAAGILALIALVLLAQVFVASRVIENVTLGYRMMLGLSGPAVDTLLSTLAGFARTLFCLSSALLFAVGGMTYALARLLVRVERQSLRIQELEAQLGTLTNEATGAKGPEREPVEMA